MCLNPVQVTRRDPVTHRCRIDVVPCGKCVECLRRKQSDYAFVNSRQAKKSGVVHFLTLTYRNDTVPMSCVYQVTDRKTGEVVDTYNAGFVRSKFEMDARFRYYGVYSHSGYSIPVPVDYGPSVDIQSEYRGTGSRHYRVDKESLDYTHLPSIRMNSDVELSAFSCPSLRRSDVTGWLKASREAFYRKYGYRAYFKYFFTGEYGPKTSRPHYHFLMYGASDLVVEFFSARWEAEYGHVDREFVRPRKGDTLEQAYEKVSRYLAKYLCKGEFDSANSQSRFVERPRRVSSLALGTSDLSDIRAYLLAFDRFGEYDPDNPPKVVLDNLAYIAMRRYMPRLTAAGRIVYTRIPKVIYEKCLSKTYGLSPESKKDMGFSPKEGTSFVFRPSHVRSLISRKIAAYFKALALESRDSRVRQARGREIDRQTLSQFREAFTSLGLCNQNTRRLSAEKFRKDLQSFYNSSRY